MAREQRTEIRKVFHEAEDLRIMQIAEEIADAIYKEVMKWNYFDKQNVGLQLVKAVDSIGANLAEGHGRFHYKDCINFIYFARGSIEEAKFWLRRAFNRKLISSEIHSCYLGKLNNLMPQVNAYINAKKRRLDRG